MAVNAWFTITRACECCFDWHILVLTIQERKLVAVSSVNWSVTTDTREGYSCAVLLSFEVGVIR